MEYTARSGRVALRGMRVRLSLRAPYGGATKVGESWPPAKRLGWKRSREFDSHLLRQEKLCGAVTERKTCEVEGLMSVKGVGVRLSSAPPHGAATEVGEPCPAGNRVALKGVRRFDSFLLRHKHTGEKSHGGTPGSKPGAFLSVSALLLDPCKGINQQQPTSKCGSTPHSPSKNMQGSLRVSSLVSKTGRRRGSSPLIPAKHVPG